MVIFELRLKGIVYCILNSVGLVHYTRRIYYVGPTVFGTDGGHSCITLCVRFIE